MQGEFRFESDGDAVFQVEVFKMPGAGFVDAEPCTVTKRVAPWAQLPEFGNKVFAYGVRNPVGFPQNSIELRDKAVHGIDLGLNNPFDPSGSGFFVVLVQEDSRVFGGGEERIAGRCQGALEISEGRDRLPEFLPEDGRTLVHRPVGGEVGSVDGQTATQLFAGLTDRVGVAGCRDAADEPGAVLTVRALLLASDASGAQQSAQR